MARTAAIDVRPVKCSICHEQMYYANHPKHEPEYTIELDDDIHYCHVRCWKQATQKIKNKLGHLVKEIEKELRRLGWAKYDDAHWYHKTNIYRSTTLYSAIHESLEDMKKKPGKAR